MADKFRQRIKNIIKQAQKVQKKKTHTRTPKQHINIITKEKLVLPDITLVCIDCINLQKAIRSMEYSRHIIQPEETLLLTSLETSYKYAKRIQPLLSKKDYSKFLIKELHKYIQTTHMLIVQHDGWALDQNAWDREWMEYDYIGSNVSWGDKKGGNGGFSLRSNKLMRTASQFITEDKCHPEDAALSSIRHKKTGFRKMFEDMGLTFADRQVQEKFGCKRSKIWKGSFGHHCANLRNWRAPKIDTVIQRT